MKIVDFSVGGGETVSSACRRLGVSERTFYRIRSACRQGGRQALAAASRAPRRPARRYGPQVVEAVACLRRELVGQGLDAGAQTIVFHLRRQGQDPVPSVSTVNRILAAQGLSRPSRGPTS